MVAIVDYNIGNLGSIVNIFKKIGAQVCVADSPDSLVKADKLVLPGVGSFDEGMKRLEDSGLLSLLTKRVLEDNIPILGICLGMQLFTKMSQEGAVKGLGWIDASTVRFAFDNAGLHPKVPHMGWNRVSFNEDCCLFRGMHSDSRFYFVHSYHVLCSQKNDVAARTFYGYEFASAIKHNNILGVQFHPEKSHKFGMKLLENFIKLS